MGSSKKDKKSHKKKRDRESTMNEKELLSTPLISTQTFLPIDSTDSELEDFLLPPSELSFNSTVVDTPAPKSSSSDKPSKRVKYSVADTSSSDSGPSTPEPSPTKNPVSSPAKNPPKNPPKSPAKNPVSVDTVSSDSDSSDSDAYIPSAQHPILQRANTPGKVNSKVNGKDTPGKVASSKDTPDTPVSVNHFPISARDKIVIIRAPVCFDITQLDSKVISKEGHFDIQDKWMVDSKYTKSKYEDFCILNNHCAVGQIQAEISINRKIEILPSTIIKPKSKLRVEMPEGLKVRPVTFGTDVPKSKKIKIETSTPSKKKKKSKR